MEEEEPSLIVLKLQNCYKVKYHYIVHQLIIQIYMCKVKDFHTIRDLYTSKVSTLSIQSRLLLIHS